MKLIRHAALTIFTTLVSFSSYADARQVPGQGVRPDGVFASGSPSTTNNDDSCDVGLYPAATLLLPYFEVDFSSPQANALNTIFTVTNVAPNPQAVFVTVWSDRAFPVLGFNLFLTGYDTATVSMYDIIARGVIPPTSVTAARGSRSLPNNTTGNPNFSSTVGTDCASLPGPLPAALVAAVQSGLTGGSYFALSSVGNSHSNAIGYVTMDVKNTCSQTFPTDQNYYLQELLFDNVLTGDFSFTNPSAATGNYATGGSLVHLRAIPEGGPAGFPVAGADVNFPYTFYDRYTSAPFRKADRRQPLPSTFAARFIQSGAGGFITNIVFWREGTVSGVATQAGMVSPNALVLVTEVVRFDERENPTTVVAGCQIAPCPPQLVFGTAPAQKRPVSDGSIFPPASFSGDVGGWLYMNLSNQSNSSAYSAPRQGGGSHAGTSQSWVGIEFVAEGRFGGTVGATWLGNGCSPAKTVTSTTGTANPIAPAANVTP